MKTSIQSVLASIGYNETPSVISRLEYNTQSNVMSISLQATYERGGDKFFFTTVFHDAEGVPTQQQVIGRFTHEKSQGELYKTVESLFGEGSFKHYVHGEYRTPVVTNKVFEYSSLQMYDIPMNKILIHGSEFFSFAESQYMNKFGNLEGFDSYIGRLQNKIREWSMI